MTPTDPRGNAVLEAVAHDLRGVVAQPPDPPPAVRVLSRDGSPIAGVEVFWSLEEDDGSAIASTISGQDGVAVGVWTLGERAGTQQIIARIANGQSVALQAIADPGPVKVLEGPDVVKLEVDQQVPAPIRLLDAFDNEVPPSRAIWSVASGDLASVDGAGVVSGLTAGQTELRVDVDGLAEAFPLHVSLPLRLAEIEAGFSHACGLRVDGAAYCWGHNFVGELGAGHIEPVDGAVRVGGEVLFAELALGNRASCALSFEGVGYCWGSRRHSLLGDGVTAGDVTQPEPIALGMTLRSLELGLHSAHCAVVTAGDVYCWGHNDFGQVGQGFASATVPTPMAVPVGGPVQEVTLESLNGCALLESGETWCWGQAGGLGRIVEDPPTASSPAPVSSDEEFVELVSGWSGTCGLTEEGAAFCWGGRNLYLEAIEPEEEFRTPTALGEWRFQSLALGWLDACGMLAAGEAVCWREELPTPLSVTGITRLAHGFDFACGLDSDGAPYCWGGDFGPSPVRIYLHVPPE